MFPQPIPKFVLDHPTYASWFDDTFLPYPGKEQSEWLQIAVQTGVNMVTIADTPVLPYPEALDYPLDIVIETNRMAYVTFYYYRLVNGRFVFSGNIRMKVWQKPPKGKVIVIRDVVKPYREQIHLLRSRVSMKYLRGSSKVQGLSSSRPVRPNESEMTPFKDFVEGSDENGNYSVRVNTISNRETRNRTWSGVRTPNFGSLALKGKLPVNGHSVSMFKESGGEVMTYVSSPTRPKYYDLEICHMSKHFALPGSPGHLSGVSDKAFARLAKKVGTIEANLAQDLVQYKQTVNMIADTARRLTMSYKSVRRGNFTEALKLLYHPSVSKYSRGAPTSNSKSAASNWLALQYGWKPLLNDIHEAITLISALNKRENGPNGVTRVTASSTKRSESHSTFPAWGEAPRVGGTKDITVSTTVRYIIYYRQSGKLTTFLQQTGFTNPLNLAWEVLPYSFVLDWLLPIGPWLETLSLWQGREFVSGVQTTFTRGNTFMNVDYAPSPGGINESISSGTWNRDDVLLNRIALTSFPNRELPSFKNPLSVTHALNALALLRVGFAASSKIRA